MRTKRILLAVIIAFVIAIGIPDFAYAEVSHWKIDEVEAGRKGYGLSVFRGIEPEPFDAEIVGKTRLNGFIYFFAKISGGPENIIDRAGVIQGMSGSPIYIDGKLVGALAYAFEFSKESIVGITPFEYMSEEARYGKKSFFEKFPDAIQGIYKGKEIVLNRIPLADFRPESIPVSLFGVSSLKASFLGINPASIRENRNKKLIPGAALSVAVIVGEKSLFSTGTVTAVDGDMIYAFGHPFLHSGTVEYPAWRAGIEFVIPLFTASQKKTNSSFIGENASVFYDGKFGVYATSGKKANMLPVEIGYEINNGEKRKFSYEVARAGRYTNLFVMLAVKFLILDQDIKENTAFVSDSRVIIAGYPEIRVQEAYFGINSPTDAVNRFLQSGEESLSMLFGGGKKRFFSTLLGDIIPEFGVEAIQKINISLLYYPEPNFFSIEYVGLDKNGKQEKRIYPGDTVYATIFVSKLGAVGLSERMRQEITVPITIPKESAAGKAMLYVESFDIFISQNESREGYEFLFSTREELIDSIHEPILFNEISVQLETPAPSDMAENEKKVSAQPILLAWKSVKLPPNEKIKKDMVFISSTRVSLSPSSVVTGAYNKEIQISKRPAAFRLESETKIVCESVHAGEAISLMIAIAELDDSGAIVEKYVTSNPILIEVPKDTAPGTAKIIIEDSLSFKGFTPTSFSVLKGREEKEPPLSREYSGTLYIRFVAGKVDSSFSSENDERGNSLTWQKIAPESQEQELNIIKEVQVTGAGAYVFVPNGAMEFSVTIEPSVESSAEEGSSPRETKADK